MTYLFLHVVISLGHIVHLRVSSSCHRSQKIFPICLLKKKKKSLPINGSTQFKHMLFKGQLYMPPGGMQC